MTSPQVTAPHVTAVAAVCSNGVIGADGDQPWRNSDDFARFKKLTLGNVLIMGRKTYEAIGRPLPRRFTIVLTRADDWDPGADQDQVRVVGDLDAAFALVAEWQPGKEIFIAGGGEIYRLAWDRTTRLELTEVDAALPGEVTFPVVDPDQWVEAAREVKEGFSWVTYVRVPKEGLEPSRR